MACLSWSLEVSVNRGWCVAGATLGGDWGEQCVERGQQMPDTSCRPGGLLGGNH